MPEPPSKPESRLRRIPSVEALLQRQEVSQLVFTFGRESVVRASRASLDELRTKYRRTPTALGPKAKIEEDIDALPARVGELLRESVAPSLIPSINATGIIIHTNLGRAPLSAAAIEAISRVASGYCNLEMDLEAGSRGSRHRHASNLLEQLFPAHRALVVNNAAAGVLLALNTLAFGKEVIISRGELVEIGGSFRIPAILERSGALLREVGTTNKTRLADYEAAISSDTGLILRVHPSNFRIVGFTEQASTSDLARLGRSHSIPVVEDFGSGNLSPLSGFGLGDEPWVSQSLHDGADSVDLSVFSGDKLLGGPQAGILIGEDALIRRCRENPMARALRVDKMTYAALEATLSAHVRDKAATEIPVVRMIACPVAAIRARADKCARDLEGSGFSARLEESSSMVGGGAGAEASIPTVVLCLTHAGLTSDALARRLRGGTPPVIGRVSDDELWLDFRTVSPDQDGSILSRLLRIDGDAGKT